MKNKIVNTLYSIANFFRRGNNRPRGTQNRRVKSSRKSNLRYNFSFNKYAESQKPQTYGPGRTFRLIENYFEAFQNGYVRFNTLFSESAEHQLMTSMYKYFKIYNVAITFFPSQAQVGSPFIQFQVNWDESREYNLDTEDDTKIVPIYRTKEYTFKFVPPDLNYCHYIIGSTNRVDVLNLRNYIRTDQQLKSIPGEVNFSAAFAFNTRIRIVAKVEYRGSRIPNSQSLVKIAEKLSTTEDFRNVPRTECLPRGRQLLFEKEKEIDELEGEEKDSEKASIVESIE